MSTDELSRMATEIAEFVIGAGRVEGEDQEWWLTSLGLEVLLEADDRGYENAPEIAQEAVRLHTKA